jgi:hypothetical protein
VCERRDKTLTKNRTEGKQTEKNKGNQETKKQTKGNIFFVFFDFWREVNQSKKKNKKNEYIFLCFLNKRRSNKNEETTKEKSFCVFDKKDKKKK